MTLGNVIRLRAIPLSHVRGERAALQNARLRASGLGWKAEPCPDPRICDLDLCVADDRGRQWHPVEPLAFAKWRVRARVDAMPAEVIVRIGPGGWGSVWERARSRRGMMLGALGLGAAAVALAVCLARQAEARRTCSV